MSTKSKTELGRIGEELAISFLENKGYEILAKNYRFKRFEIDIISKFNNLLIFVEVKSRKSNFYGNPEEAVTKTKAKQVIIAAQNYIFKTNWKADIRFDIIAITKNEIMHFEDAFY